MKIAGLLVGVSMACGPVWSQGILTTLAGTGIYGYSGDGGPAVAATLGSAGKIAADAAGNVYFYDSSRIRRVSPDGIITTIAGTGVFGHSGDGGPAVTATMGSVGQIAIRGSKLYFTDMESYKIRCIDLNTGVIQGLGSGNMGTGGDGGNIAGASFLVPWGLTFDDAGNFYISDFGANSVRRVDANTGVIAMFAGPGPGYCCVPVGDGGPAVGANVYQPMGLSYYNGGLYIADPGNNRIRRVDIATGIISTVAGSGSSFEPPGGSDGGPAILAGIVSRETVLDPSGNLYIDAGTCVRKVDGSGIITTIAGKCGTSGSSNDDIPSTEAVFGGIGGLAWDAVAKRLLLTDASTRVRQIFFTPPTTTSLVVSANPAAPGGQITLNATVFPATATGSVRFRENATLLGSVPLSNGAAEFIWTAPLGGSSSYSLRAIYGGDANNNLSVATVVEAVQQGATTTALTSSPNPSTEGESVTFTITVSPAAATGTVALWSSSAELATATLSNGVATVSLSNLPLGSSTLHAWYKATSGYVSSTSANLTQVVRAATTTSLSASPNPSTYGDAVTLTAAVTPAAVTGAVQFFNGGTLLGSANLAGGQAQLTLSTLPAGSDSLTAVYGGDAGYGKSTSAVVTQTVNKKASSVTLTSTANPSAAIQSIWIIAWISPDTATGTVQFMDGSTSLGVGTISEGIAEIWLSNLPLGDHSMTAVYSGDATVAASTSPVLVQTVKSQLFDVTLTSSPNPSKLGQTVTLTAVVSPSGAMGVVSFFGDSCLLGTARVSGGSASLSVPPGLCGIAEGSHGMQAVFDSDVPSPGSASEVLTQVILPKPTISTSVRISSSANPSTVGQAVTFTARVSPSSATGTVLFLDGTVGFATAVIANGRASVTTSALSVDSHMIVAAYSGDVNYAPIADVYSQTVSKRHTSMALSSSRNPATVGQTLTFNAVVSPHDATGYVEFFAGTDLVGTVNVSGGSATLTLPPETYMFAAGVYSITASYSGDATSAGSRTSLTQVIRKASTSVTLSSSLNPATFGQSVTFTANLSPSSATGRVQFLDGAATLGLVTVGGGTAALTLSSLPVGSHSIAAVYSGDANYMSSAPARVTQIISPAIPSAPSNLIAVAGSSSRINLSWNASATSGVTYIVYSSSVSGFTPSAGNRIASGIVATSYSNGGLPASATRFYLVTAQKSGSESARSNQASATTASRP